MEIREKHILAYISEEKGAINEQDHSINFVISSDKLDLHNEIVEVSAIANAIKDFAKNPVALAGHQHRLSDGRSPVIGSWDTDSFKALAHTSEMRLRFAYDTELGREYWTLYSQRHMRAVSIGFRVLDGHEETKDGVRIYIIEKIELFEISCVPVGANREALAKHKELCQKYMELEDKQPPAQDLNHPEWFMSEITDLKSEISNLKSSLAEKLDDLKDLIIASHTHADSADFAEYFLLGKDSDPGPAAGATNSEFYEIMLSAFQKALDQRKGNQK